MSERWVSIDDVACHLGLAKDPLYRWIAGSSTPIRLRKFKILQVGEWGREGGVDVADVPDGDPAAKRGGRR